MCSTPPGGTWSSRVLPCCLPCSRSTCSGTGSRTRSTPGRPGAEMRQGDIPRRPGRTTERIRMRTFSVWMSIALAAAGALLVAGCGGTAGKKGGTLTVLSQGDVDSLDPGYQYYQYDYEALSQPAQRTLYGWKPSLRKPHPHLAASMPELAHGRETAH